MDGTEIDETAADTSSAAETAPVESAEVAPEVTTASPGAPAESTPPADEVVTDEFAEFKVDVAKATGTEPAKTEPEKPESEAEPEVTDDPGAVETGKDGSPDLSKQPDPAGAGPGSKVPEKLTERAEWKAITAIADKVSPEAGKEARALLRGLYKTQYDLTQQVEQIKPAVQVVTEMFQAVGGSEQGFNNMRSLIVSFDQNPAAAVPMLKTLLADAEKRAGLVLQSPELLTEAQAIEQQLKDGLIDPAAAERRRNELLELQQGRMQRERQSQAQQAEQQRQAQAQAEQQRQKAVAEIDTAATAWEKDKLKNDPDYLPVKAIHKDRAFAMADAKVNELGRMLNATEVKAICEEALKQVKAEVGALAPRPKPRTVVLGGDNGSSGNNRQQPANEFEEYQADVQAALQRHRRG